MFDFWKTGIGESMEATSKEVRFWMTLTGWCAVISSILLLLNLIFSIRAKK